MEPSKPASDPASPPSPGTPMPIPPAIRAAQQSLPAAPASAPPTNPAANMPDVADDGDLIEKEWVMKVKQLVSQTAQDPHEQNRLFNKLKADYMQKRYGKVIKSED